MLSILEQLNAVQPIPKRSDAETKKKEEILGLMREMGNVRVAMLKPHVRYAHREINKIMSLLQLERKVVSYRVGNITWYSIARPARRREDA